MRSTIVSLFVAGAALALGASQASAEVNAPKVHRHHHAAPRYTAEDNAALPLTVNRRSFLDPGPAVPPGYDNNYMTANTAYVKTPDQVNDTAQFGNSTLQTSPYVGHAAPVADFATGPQVGDLYAGPLFGIGR